jgi:SAM-dependent methyltransferase
LTGTGVEIGAFKTPLPGIEPIYVDRFAEYAGEPTLADYYGDTCDLPFYNSSVDYVATSHVIEHAANPLSALAEWFRVIRHEGLIYMVIPDRQKTFDHPRPLSEPSHILEDFRNRVTQADGTHIDDFVYGVDWQMFSPDTPPEEERRARDELASVYRRSVEAGNEINIHFHTFESHSALELIRVGNRERIWPGEIRVVRVEENFPESNPIGFLVVATVHKNLPARVRGFFSKKKGLKKDARKF